MVPCIGCLSFSSLSCSSWAATDFELAVRSLVHVVIDKSIWRDTGHTSNPRSAGSRASIYIRAAWCACVSFLCSNNWQHAVFVGTCNVRQTFWIIMLIFQIPQSLSGLLLFTQRMTWELSVYMLCAVRLYFIKIDDVCWYIEASGLKNLISSADTGG